MIYNYHYFIDEILKPNLRKGNFRIKKSWYYLRIFSFPHDSAEAWSCTGTVAVLLTCTWKPQ